MRTFLLLIVLCSCSSADLVVIYDAGVDIGEGEGEGEGEGDIGEGEGEEPLCFNPPGVVEPHVPDGTEDYIDPIGDGVDSVTDNSDQTADLLATWSHIDGDDLVMEFRFASPIFGVGMFPEVAIGFLGQNLESCVLSSVIENPSPCYSGAGIREGYEYFMQQQLGVASWPVPPDVTGDEFVLDECARAFLDDTQRTLRIRLPLRGPEFIRVTEPIQYNVLLGSGDSLQYERSWTASPLPGITSRGGQALPADAYISVCDLVCQP